MTDTQQTARFGQPCKVSGGKRRGAVYEPPEANTGGSSQAGGRVETRNQAAVPSATRLAGRARSGGSRGVYLASVRLAGGPDCTGTGAVGILVTFALTRYDGFVLDNDCKAT